MNRNLAMLALVVALAMPAMSPSGQLVEGAERSGSGEPRLSTYILFKGNCREAMEFYKFVLGGELSMTTVGESPMKSAFPKDMHTKIVNATLKGPNVDISASDWLRANQAPAAMNMVCLYVKGGSQTAVRTIFHKLSDHAVVTDPLRVKPFGTYGALNDRFGVRWMFQTSEQR
jgi:PhnB protein